MGLTQPARWYAAIRDGGGAGRRFGALQLRGALRLGTITPSPTRSGGVAMVESALAPLDTSAEFFMWDPV